jgi:hypothetical protein
MPDTLVATPDPEPEPGRPVDLLGRTYALRTFTWGPYATSPTNASTSVTFQAVLTLAVDGESA